MNAYFRRLRGDSSLLPPVGLGLIVLDEGETLEIDSEDMELPSFNLFRMPLVWKSFFAFAKKVPCSCTPVVTPTNMWIHNCSHGLGRRGGPHSTHCQTLGVRRGPARLGSVIGGLFPVPSSLQPGLQWMAWMWLVRQTIPANGTRLVYQSTFVLHVIASGFRSTLGNGWSGRPLHPSLGAELDGAHGILCHARDKRPVLGVHTRLRAQWSVPALQLLCGPVCLRSWLSSSVLYLPGAVRFWQGTQKTRSFQGRPRSLSSSSPFSWVPLAGVDRAHPFSQHC